ncbi:MULTISPECIES: IclR family transcriptional regulator [unclassified Pseudomonas]|uniref:IclR family transcriptional regulator n=1 Tax=unclassified Pseudomonas TaxID=196821 RepID=UPI00067EA97C|nr:MULTISPECIES: IclR family transcriptional regulator [unclassified Pseudomonas]
MEEFERHPGIQVIARAAAIMRALGYHPRGLSLAGIAKQVSLPRSTVQRIVNALQEEQLVEQARGGAGFRLGSALGELMTLTQFDIVSKAAPVIEEMSEKIGESVALSSLMGEKILTIYCAVAKKELRIVFPLGVYGCIYSTSVGRLFLSKHPADTLEKLIPQTLPSHTPLTLGRQELIRNLEEIRELGYATESEQYIEGVYSASIDISAQHGSYAITVIAPVSRAARRENQLIDALKTAKNKIERGGCCHAPTSGGEPADG